MTVTVNSEVFKTPADIPYDPRGTIANLTKKCIHLTQTRVRAQFGPKAGKRSFTSDRIVIFASSCLFLRIELTRKAKSSNKVSCSTQLEDVLVVFQCVIQINMVHTERPDNSAAHPTLDFTETRLLSLPFDEKVQHCTHYSALHCRLHTEIAKIMFGFVSDEMRARIIVCHDEQHLSPQEIAGLVGRCVW
ncbi:uncharacterized protein LACBIDRAFT_333512 [Laccaria bicolor S238N-H82]|uniref:Predicted protein n=1 Tax=Laccaria bicolor (strain S238N-H82 / ATCC MYA-4686) TaxID=486041 RepID=B0DW56_LACBS|nr:uncharacterized protein LACBIDRAFT_333512 [Laccaria bicolor S238N-H82]EDR01124.1 predicted protein [Laccaria bicolor S238N-H82]|eukprot:XP_001888166.1 predicted protein [Laccaria bicolor S238N-H82]